MSEQPAPGPGEHQAVRSFRAELDRRGGTGRIVVLPDSVLTSGAHRVDTGKVAAELGIEALERAEPEFVRRHTGQVIGGVSPFDHPAPVRTFLDPWLRRYDVIWAAAGHPAAVFSSTYEELRQLTGADELEVE
jgi:prolyl-tRNA editing enzyme YbaK/EbsC (Cys-tRNA(Pro) deacylase)